MAGAAASVPDSLHANLLIVAESGGAVVRPDYAEGDSSRLIWKCQGIGGEDRLLRSALQPLATTFCLDGNRRLHSAETCQHLFTYFRDTTLATNPKKARIETVLEKRVYS